MEREKEKNEENKEENKRKNSPFLAVLPFHNHDQTNKQYQRAYRSICPSEWLEKWAEQREAGEFWFFVFFFRNLGGLFFFNFFVLTLVLLRSLLFNPRNPTHPTGTYAGKY